MKTEYLQFNNRDLDVAGKLIRDGQNVAFPTETVYGLGANALDTQAVKRVYEAKGRPVDNPLIVHIWNKAQIYDLASEVNDFAVKVAEQIMPAPITIVLPKRNVVSGIVTAGLPSVAIRMPLSEQARLFLKAADVPVSAPSANLSGRPSPTTWQRVAEDMDGRVAAILCGEPSQVGIESTVLDLSRDKPMILRPGAVSAERLTELLGVPVEILRDPTSKVNSPGVHYKHYAPSVPMVLELDDDVKKLCDYYDQKVAEGYNPVLWANNPQRFGDRHAVEMGDSDAEVAANLYEALRILEKRYDFIIAEFCWRKGNMYDGPACQGVLDRLLRACGRNVI